MALQVNNSQLDDLIADITSTTVFSDHRIGCQFPQAIVVGTRHGFYNSVTATLCKKLRPYIILSEDLVDSTYDGTTDTFIQGKFYEEKADKCQQRLIETAPITFIALHAGLRVVGIERPFVKGILERELHFADRIMDYVLEGERVLVEIGDYHATPGSILVRKLSDEQIPTIFFHLHEQTHPMFHEELAQAHKQYELSRK